MGKLEKVSIGITIILIVIVGINLIGEHSQQAVSSNIKPGVVTTFTIPSGQLQPAATIEQVQRANQ